MDSSFEVWSIFLLTVFVCVDLAQGMCLERFFCQPGGGSNWLFSYIYLYFHLHCRLLVPAWWWLKSITFVFVFVFKFEFLYICDRAEGMCLKSFLYEVVAELFAFCICICVWNCLCIFTCICIWPGLPHVSGALLARGGGSNWLHLLFIFVFVFVLVFEFSFVFVFDLA